MNQYNSFDNTALHRFGTANRIINPLFQIFLRQHKNVEGCYVISVCDDVWYVGKSRNLFDRVSMSLYEKFVYNVKFAFMGSCLSRGVLNPKVKLHIPENKEDNSNLEKLLIKKLDPILNIQFKDYDLSKLPQNINATETEEFDVYLNWLSLDNGGLDMGTVKKSYAEIKTILLEFIEKYNSIN